MTKITDIRTVAIPVTDTERAVDFYVTKLGFEKRHDFPLGPGARWIEVAPPGAATTIALVPPGRGERTGEQTGIRLSTPDAESQHASLRAQGVVAEEIMRWPGVPAMFVFLDPDGNRLVVVEEQARPASSAG
jgi:predicted enzyme related to lactoylglutathione lyase